MPTFLVKSVISKQCRLLTLGKRRQQGCTLAMLSVGCLLHT